MKITTLNAALGSASLFLLAQPVVVASAAHRHAHQQLHNRLAPRHAHPNDQEPARDRVEALAAPPQPELKKRATCSLPSDDNLVSVPGASNGGFAMSPDQPCKAGSYCPLACKPGMLMDQWDTSATTYAYPKSMNGGVLCGEDGTTSKPFPDRDYCVHGTGTVNAVNDCSEEVAWCQTVLPGNEAMLIPTDVEPGESVTLAVPGPSYWAGTAAHYYVNPPGVSTSDGCAWGDSSKPWGNWAPYVAGANTDSGGRTFVKIAWNPIWVSSALAGTLPTYGLKIECPDGDCVGLPCAIDPTGGVNSVTSNEKASGDDAEFCVVTVPSGSKANIVVYSTDGSSSSSDHGSSSSDHSSASSESSAPVSSSASQTADSSTSSSSEQRQTTVAVATTSSSSRHKSTAWPSTSSSQPADIDIPGAVFQQVSDSSNSTSVPFGNSSSSSSEASSDESTAPAQNATSSSSSATLTGGGSSTPKSEGAQDQKGVAVMGFIIAFVAAAALF